MQRRRARTMESGTFDRRRGKGRLKAPGTSSASTADEITQQGSRCRSNSFASSRGRLSPIQSEAEPGTEWSLGEQVTGAPSSQFIISGSQQQQHQVTETTTHFPVSAATASWQNFTMTLNDPTGPLVTTSTPLVTTASGQTAVLFVERVSTAKLPENHGGSLSQAPVIVLLAAPQATLPPQFIPSLTSGVAAVSPSSQNNVSRITFGRLEAISDAKITQQILPKRPAVPPPKDPEPPVVRTPNVGIPPKTKSVSESYLQVLRFLTSKNVRAYMKTHPDFKEKLCELLLAKKAKMIQEMNDQQQLQQPRRILPELMKEERCCDETPRVQETRRVGSSVTDRIRLEEILNSISLTCESSSSNQPLPQSSMMQDLRPRPDRSTIEEIMNLVTLSGKPVGSGGLSPQASATQPTSPNVNKALPKQLGGLDIDIDQDIALEPDFLFDFNLDNLAGDLNCDDDFLNQF